MPSFMSLAALQSGWLTIQGESKGGGGTGSSAAVRLEMTRTSIVLNNPQNRRVPDLVSVHTNAFYKLSAARTTFREWPNHSLLQAQMSWLLRQPQADHPESMTSGLATDLDSTVVV